MGQELPKSARVYLRSDIGSLFERGSSFSVRPIKCYYRVVEGGEGVQLMVAAPKKFFKRAVHRNYVKRRLRESFRLGRDGIGFEGTGNGLQVALIYSGGQLPSSADVDRRVGEILSQLRKRLVISD